LILAAVRVLHVAAGNLFGGVETFLVTLARYRESVPQLESEFALCFDGRLGAELRRASATVHQLGSVRLRNPFSVLRANLDFLKVLRDNRYDAVATHGAWPHAVVGLSAKLMGRKLVTWAHGAPLRLGRLDRIADRISPDLVIVNSRHTAAALGTLFEGVPSQLIYYPVEPRAVHGRSRTEIRRELQTSENGIVLAFAARFERWKGHDLLLRAARALLDRTSSDWCIWLCGGVQRASEKAYLAELESYVKGSGLASRIRFLGQRSDVPELLRAADVFCQPNTGPEPFGIVFIEALYAGLPVVSTNMGGAAEIVDESCGLLAEPEPHAVADALYRLVTDTGLRLRLASKAADRARLLCDPEPRIRDIAEAIRA
jgi:glycosyltransferase involved in cell wall biosynthesis